ncbi:MAG: hypothetical protein C0600_11780 [Ignavibacteria bacterium]|nr:MAG: hypothetical protein C0600_11780 [Ignavibacteria bacterium]
MFGVFCVFKPRHTPGFASVTVYHKPKGANLHLENEFADDFVHNDIRLESGLAEFLYRALRHEEKRLRLKTRHIEDHHELAWIALSSPQLEVYQQTYKWTGKFRQLIDELLRTAGGQDGIQLGDMKHGMLRKLKAIGLAYTGFLKEELQSYGEQPYHAQPVSEDIADGIQGLEEQLSLKPFDAVSPAELLP